jgi:hypothetical protein
MKALMVFLTIIVSLIYLQAQADNMCMDQTNYSTVQTLSALGTGRSPASDPVGIPAEGKDPNLNSELGGNTRVGNTILNNNLDGVSAVTSIDNGSTYLGSNRSSAATPDQNGNTDKKPKKKTGVGQANYQLATMFQFKTAEK